MWNGMYPLARDSGREGCPAALERARLEVSARCVSEDRFDGESLKTLERTVVDKVEIAAINIAERHQPNEVFDRLNRKRSNLDSR